MTYTSVGIDSVEIIKMNEKVPVYDIETPVNHNFKLSNGIVVHNSKDLSDSLCGAFYNASKFKFLPHIKYAASDAETASDLYGGGLEQQQKEERNLLGIDTDKKVIKTFKDMASNSDDILDW